MDVVDEAQTNNIVTRRFTVLGAGILFLLPRDKDIERLSARSCWDGGTHS